MTTRSDGDSRRRPVVDEDDWFATPAVEPTDLPDPPGEVSWQDEPEPEYHPPRRADDGLRRRQAAVVLAALVAVALGAAGILLARSLGGDDGAGATTATTAQVTTTQVTTTPTASTPTTTTPTTTTPSTTTPSSGAVPTDAVLRPGDTGAGVTALQEALTGLGFTPGTADGKYGAATTEAVAAFQEANDLTADGIAGPKTIAAINAAVAAA